MTIQSIGPFIPDMFPIYDTGALTLTSILLDANGEKAAGQAVNNKTGNVRKVGFLTGTVTTGDTVTIRPETESAGFPSGTLVTASAETTQVIAAADDNVFFEVTLPVDAAVTAGTNFWVVIGNGAVGNLNITRLPPLQFPSRHPKGAHYTASWASLISLSNVAITWDDGLCYPVPGFAPMSSVGTTSYNSGSATDEYGNILNVTAVQRWAGLVAWGDFDTAGSSYEAVVYSTDGATVLATGTLVGESVAATSNPGTTKFLFSTPLTVAIGNGYRVTIKPLNTTSITMGYFNVANNAHLGMWPCGISCYSTSRVNAGSWTDLNTRRYWLLPIIDGIDDGAGGGGGAVNPFNGIIVG